jgi:hypothetical protein
VYAVGGCELALLPRPEGTRATHTAVGFRVPDIEEAIRALKSRGVRLADYDPPA